MSGRLEPFGLIWPGKKEAAHDAWTPARGRLVLRPDASLDPGDAHNLVVAGDNLDVLKLLLPAYRAAIQLIYIDPPYNTGHTWVYEDHFRGPERTQAAGRHAAWLSMMYPRLLLAREFLQPRGCIFVSIDDHEVHHLRLLLDDIFGEEQFLACVVWQKKYTRANDARWFSATHEYLLVYAKDREQCQLRRLPRTQRQLRAYSNPDGHPKGPWKPTPLHAKSGRAQAFTYTFQNGVQWSPPPGTYPRYSPETLRRLEQQDEIWFGPEGRGTPARKRFLAEVRPGVTPTTLWSYQEVGHTHEATNELKALLPDNPFPNPKPTRLIRRILALATEPEKGEWVLDFFAGSGTTGQAVMEQNLADGGNRRYLLVQRPDPLPDSPYGDLAGILRERLQRACARLPTPWPAGTGFRFLQWVADDAEDGGGAIRIMR
ncbi:MAG: site-specific DNA-methyltransferase [Alicyclobacillus sp.]|nr:site-specific DNA-methyltransferase [Alicyclobacillus sp.]